MSKPSRFNNFIVYDIETAISERGFEHLSKAEYKPDPKLADLDSPPKSITGLKSPDLKAQRLKDWRAEQKKKIAESIEAAKMKAIDKAALYWWYGKIVSVSLYCCATGEHDTFYGPNEKSILVKVGHFFKSHAGTGTALCGKHSKTFDDPYMIGRYMAHDLGVPEILKRGNRILGHGAPVDIEWIFGPHRHDLTPSLDKIAFGLGLDQKLAKGSEVAAMVREGRWQELKEYNEQDVVITAECLRRFLKDFSAAD